MKMDDQSTKIGQDAKKLSEINELGEPEQLKHFKEVIVDEKFTTDYTIIRGGKEITIPVVDLDFDGADIFELDLLAGVHKTPKARRAERRKEFLEKIEAIKKPCKAKGKFKRVKMDYAMKELSKGWHEGMDEDLKEKTVSEVFDLLIPGAGKDRSNVKIKKSKFKKD